MKRLALFVIAVAACSKVDNTPALREEAHAVVTYYGEQLDSIETRFQHLARRGADIKRVLDGGDEMGRMVVTAFNGFVELNKRLGEAADAIQRSSDDDQLRARIDAYRELAEDGVAGGSDHVAVPSIPAVGSVLTTAESWIERAHSEMATLGSGSAIMQP